MAFLLKKLHVAHKYLYHLNVIACMKIEKIKKMKKGKSVEEIADMLEETPEKIQNIYELARNMEPDYDVEKICGQLSR